MSKYIDDQIVAILEIQDGFVDKAVGVLLIELEAELRKRTPVDTGWASTNWIASLSNRTKTIGSKQNVPLGYAAAAAVRVGATFDHTKHRKAYLTNNVYYIVRLNAGSSQQAPAAFVQTAIRNTVPKVHAAMRRPEVVGQLQAMANTLARKARTKGSSAPRFF